MKTLYIDTHLFDIDIILFDDKQIIKRKKVENEKYNSIYLISTLKEVCPDKDFDEIVVINGPGSFTGVRLGVTIAKTLAYTLNRPIKTLSYFDLMNYSSDDSNHIFAISDGNGFYIGEYTNHLLVKDYYYLNNSEYTLFNSNNNVETNVTIDFTKVLEHLKEVDSINPHLVKPLYIKLIGVEK